MLRHHPWRNPRYRGWLLQLLLGAILLGLAVVLVDNTAANLAERNIPFGLDFLDNIAGFDIPFALIAWSPSDTYARAILVGLLNTALVVVLGIALSTIVGFSVGTMRLSPNWLLRTTAAVFVEFVRNTPALLQIVFCYLALIQSLPTPRDSLRIGDSIFLNIRGLFLPAPLLGQAADFLAPAAIVAILLLFLVRHYVGRQHPRWRARATAIAAIALLGLLPAACLAVLGVQLGWSIPRLQGFRFVGGIVLVPELVALVVGLSIYSSAFIAEIVRAGILSVARGQIEAARALGLRPRQVLTLVILPQALRAIVPPLTSQYLNLIKGSSLAVAIAYPDLVQILIGSILNRTGRAIEIMAMTMAIYLTLCLSASLLMNWYNRRKALVER
jgi:general L-amino acid transport system permease protein